MKLKETESIEDRYLRENAIYSQTRKSAPFAIGIIMLACIALMLYALNVDLFGISSSNHGNPYMCESCKALGHACKEHKDFDSTSYLEDLTTRLVYNYTNGDSEETIQYILYGYGNTYNTECDFCVEDKTECYGCISNRRNLVSTLEQVEDDPVFLTFLCDDCYPSGSANCDMCKEIEVYQIMVQFVPDYSSDNITYEHINS